MASAPIAQGALRPMLERGERARASFIAMRVEEGFTASEGATILAAFLKLKVAKIDYGVGQVNVRHGALLDAEPLRNALAYGKERGL